MFSLFKKKKPGEPSAGRGPKADAPDVNPVYEQDVAVHVMPGRFRQTTSKASSAKRTGIIVLVSGIIFLVSLLILAYFFVFKAREKTPVPAPAPAAVAPAEAIPPAPAPPPPAPAPAPAPPPEPVPGEPTAATAAPPPPVPAPSAATSTAPETATTSPSAPAPAPPMPPAPAPDTDADGLSDQEEAVLGTGANSLDSDADGYPDLSELASFYDPAGSGRIADNPAISRFENATFGYSFYYPDAWPVTKFGGDDSAMLMLDYNQFIQVIVQPNPDKTPILEWYREQFGLAAAPADRLIAKDTWQGVLNDDGLILYLTDSGRLYIVTITYNLGPANTTYFRNLFELLINSFAFDYGGDQ